MTKKIFILFFFILNAHFVSSQTINDIELTNAITGKTVNVGAEIKGKGLILIFHSLKCPFAKMYEDRLIALRSKYTSQGFNFILVNTEVGNSPEEQASLRNHVDQSGLKMSYLIDAQQALTKHFKITKIPEVVLLTPSNEGEFIAYRGAIDNNPQAEGSVSSNFLDNAIDQLLKGEQPSPSQARAVGCNVRTY